MQLSRLAFLLGISSSLLYQGAFAGSVVVFGDQIVVRNSGADLAQEESKALSYCSSRDKNCKTIVKCTSDGFGAVVASRIRSYVDAIGASCGKDSYEAARDEATRLCNQNAKYGQCGIEHAWNDR